MHWSLVFGLFVMATLCLLHAAPAVLLVRVLHDGFTAVFFGHLFEFLGHSLDRARRS